MAIKLHMNCATGLVHIFVNRHCDYSSKLFAAFAFLHLDFGLAAFVSMDRQCSCAWVNEAEMV